MTSSKELWTNLHKESRYRPKYPSETVVQYVFRNFERCGSEKVLDLGCGAGRHIFFMAAEGIIPYGLDYSSEGVTYTQNMLQEQGIGKYSSNIKEGSMTEIPFENEMFDGIICYGALYYLCYKDIERTICEMERVLKPGGKFMCVVRSTDDYRCQEENCKETEEPNTFYIEVEDKSKCAHSENGMILHFFTEWEITTLFKNFVEISIDKITESHNNGKEGYIDMIVLSGHQPNYLPYPGLIGKILHSDKFIYVSNVQLEKKSWQNRNRIKGANGEIMLSVPVLTKGKFNQTIKDTQINNEFDWEKKHFQAINLSYKKSKYYNYYIDFFDDLYKKEWTSLNDLDIYITNWILNELKINTKIYYDTEYDFIGKNNELLIEMTKALDCDTYLSNKGSENYVDIDMFVKNGLNHQYLNYKDVEYHQCFKSHLPYLSILDMLFNLGSEQTYDIISDKANYDFSELNQRLGE